MTKPVIHTDLEVYKVRKILLRNAVMITHCQYRIHLGNQLPASMHTDPATSDAAMGVQQPQELAKGRKTQQGKLFYLSMGTHNSYTVLMVHVLIIIFNFCRGCRPPQPK